MSDKSYYSPAKRVSQIKWNNKNIDKVKEYGRVCYEKLKTDPERLQAKKEYAKKYYLKHKEEISLNRIKKLRLQNTDSTINI